MGSKNQIKGSFFLGILSLFLCYSFCHGQSQPICGSHLFQLKKATESPEYLRQVNEDHVRVMSRLNSRSKSGYKSEFIIRIPVVVHLVGDNVISNAQHKVEEQIAILNEDFRRISGTNGFGDGVDTKIEFCLATVKPDGISPTSGVNLHYDDPHNPYPSIWEPVDGFINNRDFDIKAIEHWDEKKYLNLYVVEQMRFRGYNPSTGVYEWFDLLGYASFPKDLESSPNLDGVVIGLDFFGLTSNPRSGLGRTTTHEVGHWLNLRHVWGDGGCEADDFVDDTPICSFSYYAQPPCTGNIECSLENLLAGSSSNERPIENYMDYSDDVCMNGFTEGQKERMRDCLFNERYSLTYYGSNYIGCIANNHCANGVQDFDERGVDCGGKDCLPCASFWPNGTYNCVSYLGSSQLFVVGQDDNAPFALTCNVDNIELRHSCPRYSQVFLPDAYGIEKSSDACKEACKKNPAFTSNKCNHYKVFFSIQKVDFNLTPVGPEHSKFIEAAGNCINFKNASGCFPGTSLPRTVNELVRGLPVNIEWQTLYKLKLGGNDNVSNSSRTKWVEQVVYFYPIPQIMNVAFDYDLSLGFAKEILVNRAINSTKNQTFYADKHIIFSEGASIEVATDNYKLFEISNVNCSDSKRAKLDSSVQAIAPLFSPELIFDTQSFNKSTQK